MRTFIISGLLMVLSLQLSACGPKRPILYPNDHLKEVGQERANQDIDECIRVANEYQAGGDKAAEIAKDTGKAAVIGTATGAAIGAVSGNIRQGSAIGAVGAATAALTSGIMRSDEPDPVFKKFVDQCLREKGFQAIGWR